MATIEGEQLERLTRYVGEEVRRSVEFQEDPAKASLAVAKQMVTLKDRGLIHDYDVRRLQNLELFDVFFCCNLSVNFTADCKRVYRLTTRKIHHDKAA